MEYCLRLRGVSGTENGLRIQKAVGRSVRSAMPAGDDGVTPVIAVVLMIGLIAVAGAVIGLVMFAALDDASGTLPDVRFQASADGVSLYHAGGDVLPLKNLVFYDGEMNPVPSVQLIKGGSAGAVSPAEGDVWETGDKIQFAAGVLTGLSIIGQDSRGNPALLWRGVNAMVLPIGDMVPDEWGEIPGGGDTPAWPSYTFDKLKSWEELLKNGREIGWVNTEEYTVYYDERDGTLCLAYNPWIRSISPEVFNNDTYLSDFIRTSETTCIGMDFNDVRYRTNVTGTQWKDRKWDDGTILTKKGTLYEENGMLYIWVGNNDYYDAINRLPSEGGTTGGEWHKIGTKKN